MSNRKPPPRGGSETDAARLQTIDKLIDEMGAQSFPASDPPAWGIVSARLDQVRWDAGQGKGTVPGATTVAAPAVASSVGATSS
jgi:hypothetical protein